MRSSFKEMVSVQYSSLHTWKQRWEKSMNNKGNAQTAQAEQNMKFGHQKKKKNNDIQRLHSKYLVFWLSHVGNKQGDG